MTQIISTQAQHQAGIEQLLDQCFGPGRLTRTAERLRETNQQIAAYGFVCLGDQGQVQASISYWPVRIGQQPALLLGPLAVNPELQSKGVGLALMQHSLSVIDGGRFPVVILVGDLPYYQRVGFAIANADIAMPGPVDANRLLVRGEARLLTQLAGMVRPAPDLC
jgi:predicted N-acetyltransferase YhbS